MYYIMDECKLYNTSRVPANNLPHVIGTLSHMLPHVT